MAEIQQQLFCGAQAVIMETDELKVTLVPAWGSNVVSLISKRKDVELLRSPASAEDFWARPVLYGIPILFPPNRINGGTFTFNDHTYQFKINDSTNTNHIHGVVVREPWELIHSEVEKGKAVVITQFDSTLFPDVMAQFPHAFKIRMTNILEGASFTQTATVINEGDQPFPWGLGYHTTFRFPFREGDAIDQCTIALSAHKEWELAERNLPTGKLLEIENLAEFRDGRSVDGWKVDNIFQSSVDLDQANQAVLYDGNIGLKLTYSGDESFKHWVVYTGEGNQGFICPEPYTWVTNAPNLQLPHEVTGLKVVGPGEQTSVTCIIHIEIDN